MNKKEIYIVLMLLVLGFLIRILMSNSPGFVSDVLAHKEWAQSLYQYGVPEAYTKAHTNLPPVFVYILYLISYPCLRLEDYSYLFLKLPGIISDIGISTMIYLIAKRKLRSQNVSNRSPLICMGLFLFSPAAIFASSIWGKWDDSLLSFFLLVTIYNYNSYKEGIFYALAILTKLQGAILAPILLRRKGMPTLIITFVLTAVLVLLPFLSRIGIMYESVVTRSINWFPHITINAYNFWWLFNWTGWGKDWFEAPADTKLYFIIPKYFGLLVYMMVSILLNIYTWKNKYKMEAICFSSFFIYFTSFMFLTRIHERYMFYCLPFLVLMVSVLGYKKFLYSYLILSITFFLNLYIVYEQNYPTYFPSLYKSPPLTIIISLINLSVFICMLLYLIKNLRLFSAAQS